jgi:hypothetical protein
VGIFQYESAGMQKYMKELKPTVFPDLIAMRYTVQDQLPIFRVL